MEKYYIMINGQQDGPFTKQEIISKGFSKDSYIFNKRLGTWKQISEVAEFSSSSNNELVDENKKNNTSESEYKNKTKDSNKDLSQLSNSSSKNKKEMFSNPFSFDGRIRRTEYGISFIIQTIVSQILSAMIIEIPGLFFLFIPVFWFGIAQGAKRCHDLGNSGWWQIIPFYGLWMLFQDGKPGTNEYGLNPKE